MTSQNRLRLSSLALISLAAACSDPSSPTSPETSPVRQLPLASASRVSAAVPGEYIVTFEDSETDPVGRARALVAQQNASLRFTYEHALKGFSAQMSPQAAAALARAPGIKRVEQDVTVHVSETVAPISWGLDRIDQAILPLNNSYTFNSRGTGVKVYIVDTGIRASHADFGGRVVSGYSAFADGTNDCHGHGTHVAGTVGGATAGVARGVTLVAVRVMDCNGSGSTSGVIAGLNYIAGQKKNNPGVPTVANLSIGGSANTSLDDAVRNAVSVGVTVAVAAGNSGGDACNESPSRAASAITVGATESNDVRSGYSNYGTCVDIFAPGSGITSTYISDDNSFAGMSGTSMATPHVAGVAALILGDYPTLTPEQVRSSMLSSASNLVQAAGAGSTTALLTTLYSAPTAAPAPAPAPAPTTGSIALSVSKSRSGKFNNATLTWSGATASTVDIFRNDALRLNTANDGSHSENKLTAGTYTYKVCQGATCSPSVTITF